VAHAHVHPHPHTPARETSRRALALALAITAGFAVVEVAGGLLTGSLALLADAVHMLSDNVAIALALVAVWLAGKPSTPERTFGYQRAEVLVALANGVVLVALAIWIFYAAIGRLDDPTGVLGGWMLAVAAVGIGANLAAAAVLQRARGGLNVEAAFRHVLADLLGSFGVVAAAIVILATGWLEADPIAGMLIAVLVLASSWSILRDSTRILLEAAPSGIDTRAVGERLARAPGVVEVHDLHIWTITSGFAALSAHVLVRRGEDCHGRRRELEALLREEFGIEHTTLQVDHAGDEGLVELGRVERREAR
jgi:cobalt-zinc-cadmium efflux system protein